MTIIEQLEEGILTLFLNGNFDETSSPAVEEKVELALVEDIDGICFDMKGVEYISSAGIRVLIVSHKKAIKTGKKILVGEMSEKVKDILDVVGILPLFGAEGGGQFDAKA
ncbi:STAS domain-containing protein [Candidatus Omnitrophota bacterium]